MARSWYWRRIASKQLNSARTSRWPAPPRTRTISCAVGPVYTVFIFDIIYVRGFKDESCDFLSLNVQLKDRKKVLSKVVKREVGRLETVEYKASSKFEDIKKHFEAAVSRKEEGIIIKAEGSCYSPGQRNNFWIKMKADYVEDYLNDFDMVIIGGYYGEGLRRPGNEGKEGDWTTHINHFLVGIRRNDAPFKIEPLAKVGQGFSANDITNLRNKLKSHMVRVNSRESRLPLPEYYGFTDFCLADYPDG